MYITRICIYNEEVYSDKHEKGTIFDFREAKSILRARAKRPASKIVRYVCICGNGIYYMYIRMCTCQRIYICLCACAFIYLCMCAYVYMRTSISPALWSHETAQGALPGVLKCVLNIYYQPQSRTACTSDSRSVQQLSLTRIR